MKYDAQQYIKIKEIEKTISLMRIRLIDFERDVQIAIGSLDASLKGAISSLQDIEEKIDAQTDRR